MQELTNHYPFSIKAKKTSHFQRPGLFHKVMGILAAHHFRLPVRRFVIDLFDKRVMRQIVLEEEGDEPEHDDDEEESKNGLEEEDEDDDDEDEDSDDDEDEGVGVVREPKGKQGVRVSGSSSGSGSSGSGGGEIKHAANGDVGSSASEEG